MNQSEEARRLLDAALAGQPRSWAAMSERGRLALETGSVEEAEKWFRQAVAAKPYEKDATYGLYQCLVRLGKGPEAEQVLARFKRIDADLNRMADLAQAIAYDGHNADLRCEAGTTMLRNGLEAEGVEWLESALREDPGHVPSHRALAEYYERTGALDRAARHRQFAPAAADPPVPSAPTKSTP
jgi:predicted Zn-dependent protease